MAEIPAHLIKKTVTDIVMDPAHDARTGSKEFTEAKKRLQKDGHFACWVCGTTENVQVHHYLCEWMYWNDANPAAIKATAEEFDPYGYGHLLRNVPVTSVDDIRNLLCLCRRHHIEKPEGIHETTFPTFILQKVTKATDDPIPDKYNGDAPDPVAPVPPTT